MGKRLTRHHEFVSSPGSRRMIQQLAGGALAALVGAGLLAAILASQTARRHDPGLGSGSRVWPLDPEATSDPVDTTLSRVDHRRRPVGVAHERVDPAEYAALPLLREGLERRGPLPAQPAARAGRAARAPEQRVTMQLDSPAQALAGTAGFGWARFTMPSHP